LKQRTRQLEISINKVQEFTLQKSVYVGIGQSEQLHSGKAGWHYEVQYSGWQCRDHTSDVWVWACGVLS